MKPPHSILTYTEDCSALLYDDQKILDIIIKNEPNQLGGVWKKGAAAYAETITSLPFPQGATERERLLSSVKNDVEFLRLHPLMKPDVRVTGWIYDLKTGVAEKVQPAL